MAALDRKALLEQIEKAQEALRELDAAKLDELRQLAGELGYDLVLRGSASGRRGRRSSEPGAPKRTYSIDPAKAVETQFKRSYTKAKAAGSTDGEALKIANDTAALTAQKKSVPYTPHKKAPVK